MTTEQKPVFDPSTLSPEALEYFAAKEKPLAEKKNELLSQVSEYKRMIDELGGIDALKVLKTSAEEATSKAEAARLAALSKEDLLKEQDSKYAAMLGERDEKITKFQQRVIDKELNAAVTAEIAAAEGNPKLLAHIVRQAVKASLNDEGEVVFEVTGADGKPTDIKSLVASLRADDDYAVAFKAPHVSGTGTRKSSDALPSVDNPWDPKTPNLTKQMELIKSDPGKAAKLAAVHGAKV